MLVYRRFAALLLVLTLNAASSASAFPQADKGPGAADPATTLSKELDARQTPHVTISTFQPASAVQPGMAVRLGVVILPGPDTHLYAPGAEKLHYHVTSLTFTPSALYQAGPTSYPKAEPLHLPELDQTVPVFSGRTVLSGSLHAPASKGGEFQVTGVIDYQACTSKVCFPPVRVPVAWSIGQRPLHSGRGSGASRTR